MSVAQSVHIIMMTTTMIIYNNDIPR